MTTTPTTTASSIEAPTMRPPAATATGLVKVYGRGDTEVRALDGASLVVPAGQLTAIMGPSGSGKSTLMQTMAGLDPVDQGSIRLGDTEVTTLSEKQRTLLRRERIGFVFQSFNLVPSLTARENITLPLRLAGRSADTAWFEELVTILGLGDRLTHRPTELSGGQQQRVAVARALVTRPDIVFADEPTGNLDSRHGQALLAFLQRAAGELGQTVVMVTHDPTAASYADRVVFLVDGRVVSDLAGPTVTTVLTRMAELEQPASRAGR
ncbi:ABC transporter ATP-binding protein [Ornithinimicrobium pekingense]|uniref:ABC transporter ATP-binding protein n=1 Tax=Ornithinimicrobium pekingense TaxID=384677 RepID=A0ABQ2F951_9MICO|nr:ABC transporter ATP-binding protein [Ornithinimicrobium pekingense]GGK63270.1 ABC transporter ATP-binding protein [Ornithinimicrobium pekingense]